MGAAVIANPSFLERLTYARDLIRDGMSLSLAARAVGMTRDELDIHLWNTLGAK